MRWQVILLLLTFDVCSLDLQKWMRIDFREERKWKYAVCYDIATAVLEWHAAGGHEERVQQGICVMWKKGKRGEARDETDAQNDSNMEAILVDSQADKDSDPRAMTGDLSEEEDDDDDQEGDQPELLDFAPSISVKEALDDAAQATTTGNDEKPLEPKMEDVEGTLPPMEIDEAQATTQPKDEPSESTQKGLKETSTNPILGATDGPAQAQAQPSTSTTKSSGKSKHKAQADSRYAPIRESLAYSEDGMLFLRLEDLSLLPSDNNNPTTEGAEQPPSIVPDLDSIFPDLPPLGMLDVAPVVVESKKASKKTERDDPNKRLEETTFNRITPLSRFTRTKPTLLGPLQPSKRWRGGRWVSLPDAPLPGEGDGQPAKAEVPVNGKICTPVSMFIF